MNIYKISQASEWVFIFTCVDHPDAYLMDYIIDKSSDMSSEDFYEQIPEPEKSVCFGESSILLKNDYAVSFYKSQMPSGLPLLYFTHSATEHVFIQEKYLDGLDLEKERKTALYLED